MDKNMKGLIEKIKYSNKTSIKRHWESKQSSLVKFWGKVITIDRKGNKILKGKYALNVQCSWRLTQNSQIKGTGTKLADDYSLLGFAEIVVR